MRKIPYYISVSYIQTMFMDTYAGPSGSCFVIFSLITNQLTKTSRASYENIFEHLFRCVVLGHVATPEVHHCNLLAITEKIQYIHTQMHSKHK